MTLSQKCCRGSGARYKQQRHISHVCSQSNSNNWHNHVPSSLKDASNNRVFICPLNAMYHSVVLTDAGRAFQAHAVATGNARSPSVVLRVVGTSSVCMYVYPKIYIQRALSKKDTVTPWSQTNRNVFSARLNRSVG